jgi:2-furoyl-CoA dehydrogenase FAD binding subunit
MKPARFDYVRAESVAEAHEALANEGSDASVIAGGQTLVPLLSMRMARPGVLVDIMRIGELSGIAIDNNSIRVGAAVRQAELLAWPALGKQQPLLALALPWVGHAQTRARGTVCGSIALADPSAELPLSLLALGGEVELSSAKGKRSVAADDFFQGIMSTARNDDELIEAVRFPCATPGQGFAFREFARRHGDFAIVACAAVATRTSTRLAVGGVADRAVVQEFETLEGSALDDALEAFADELEARDDLHATADYRRMLVRRIGREVIEEARRRCRV